MERQRVTDELKDLVDKGIILAKGELKFRYYVLNK